MRNQLSLHPKQERLNEEEFRLPSSSGLAGLLVNERVHGLTVYATPTGERKETECDDGFAFKFRVV